MRILRRTGYPRRSRLPKTRRADSVARERYGGEVTNTPQGGRAGLSQPPQQQPPQQQPPPYAQPSPHGQHQPPPTPGDGGHPGPRPVTWQTSAWILAGIAAIAVVGIPFLEFVYKPMLVDIATAIARDAGSLGQRPTDWDSAALTGFVVLTVVQVAVPVAGYVAAVLAITRIRARATSIVLTGLATVGIVFGVMQAAIRPRGFNPGLGSREQRFADRFEGASPDALAIIWQTAYGPIAAVLCCAALLTVLLPTTWRQGKPPRRPRAAWPWLLPVPLILIVAVGVQIGSQLSRFPG